MLSLCTTSLNSFFELLDLEQILISSSSISLNLKRKPSKIEPYGINDILERTFLSFGLIITSLVVYL